MNILLSLNKKKFLFLTSFVLVLFMSFLFLTYFKTVTKKETSVLYEKKIADITKPKFSINGEQQKISITANEGNFLTDDKILLEENVIFQSEKFKIYSDNVVFNKKDLVASSKDKSKFVSDTAQINSTGFDITENGSIINFKGKTKLILK